MQWRRGLFLAAIHLAVAMPLIAWMESRDERSQEDRVRNAAAVSFDPPAKPPDLIAGDETVSFSPCAMTVSYPPQQVVVTSANMPAIAATGWRLNCPPSLSMSGRLHLGILSHLTRADFSAQRRVDLVLCLLISIQWLVVGSFPLALPIRWWGEPGMLITILTLAADALVVLPGAGFLSQLPALCTWLTLFWWFGLLCWRLARLCWRLAKRHIPRSA